MSTRAAGFLPVSSSRGSSFDMGSVQLMPPRMLTGVGRGHS